jgi:4-hydroxybenzoate polyprenyltransferase
VVLPAFPILFVQTKSVLLLLLVRFLYVGMLCIIFDKRDVLVDRMHGLRSLATELSLSALKKIMGMSFVTYLLAVLWFLLHGLELGQAIALCGSGIVAGWVYMLSSSKQQGYVFYYFVVDGLMLFTAGASALFVLL